ncbi:hypothetical protein T03_2504 [Trichinella britovi]|uniref:Uncharacterized protein n=1 Tax=Trichinella britovi TaxID=45882 RepID=A0A0V1AIP9_TRIBR|nr:hypothetical protein T03_2504 [Trichinella britovi]
MTNFAFRRDITAHLLRARPLQILRPKRHVEYAGSLHSLQKKLQKLVCSVWQTASPDRFPNISSAAQYHDGIV